MTNFRINVSTWWESTLPAHVPHRSVLLQATFRIAYFCRSAHQLFLSVPDCVDPSVRCEVASQVSGLYTEMEHWASQLGSDDEVGTLELAAHGTAVGTRAAIKRWLVDEVGSLVRSQHVSDWAMACESEAVMPPCLNMLSVGTGMLHSVLQTMLVWPWLVDMSAIASAAGVRAVVPEGVMYTQRSVGVVRELLAALEASEQGSLAVEVGVDRGQLSEYLLREFPRLRLVGVDPYPDVYRGVPSSERLDNMGSLNAYLTASERYSRFDGRAELWRTPSLHAARAWERGPVDLVFIDGEHDFLSCRDDIRAWSPLVRPGGVVSGHDYYSNEEGVPRAVHGELPVGATLHLGPHGVWWWIKP